MQHTPQQRDAITIHDRNLIVVAGAGSGKTRVLVERYLALLEANPDWRLNQLVAITFTHRAAGEMRDRVRRSLEDRLRDARDDQESARWSSLLASMDSARIDTIHGLCAALLRANAAEAGVDPDFGVLDETEAAILLENAAGAALAELVVSGGPAAELLVEYTLRDISSTLIKRSLLNAVARQPAAFDWLQYWVDLWWSELRQQVKGYLSWTKQAFIPDDPPPGDRLGDAWLVCHDALEALRSGPQDGYFAAFQSIAALDLRGGAKDAWGDKEAVKQAKDSLSLLRDEARNLVGAFGDFPSHLDERAAQLLLLWIDLLRHVNEVYRAMKARASLLDFDDLEDLTRDLLAQYPAVKARYQGGEFRHILVDEFQDTNDAQWQIIQALAPVDQPGALFVVGDEKQSIYAFRGADVSVFGKVRAQITEAGGRALDLSTSFRTHQPLVNCFNDLFGALLVRDLTSPVRDYQVERGTPMTAVRQHPPDTAPALELLLVDSGAGESDGKLNMDDSRRQEGYLLAQRIAALVAEGRLIYDKETGAHRPVQYGDIAVLYRAGSTLPFYEGALKAAGIPYVTAGGRGYYDRQEVWDMLSLLQALHNPADDLALAVALRSPLFALSDDALLALRLTVDAQGGRLSLWDALASPGDLLPEDERAAAAFARSCLEALRALTGRVTVSELLRESLARTGYLAVLAGLPDGARRRGNVEKLLDKAQSTGRVTLGEFARYLRDLSAREVREGDAPIDAEGAVSLMTIHGSKGLEFPVVALVDTVRKKSARDSGELVIADAKLGLSCKVYEADGEKLARPFAARLASAYQAQRDDAESLRLLYVGMTRAQDLLLISGQVSEDKKTGNHKTGDWLGLLLDTLGVYDHLQPAMDVVLDYPWGGLRVWMPGHLPDNALRPAPALSGDSAWASDAIRAGEPLPGPVLAPDLLAGITVPPAAQVRHLAATSIEDLGGAEHNPFDKWRYRSRFRRKLLHDAPTEIDWVSASRNMVSARQIGEIVHHALRWWRFPTGGDDAQFREILRSYAWREGITAPGPVEYAVDEALKLLRRFTGSDVFAWMNGAQAVYREIPFIYERDGRIIHGIMDTLLRQDNGAWAIVDYKTSSIPNIRKQSDAAAVHARRYHLQLGIYAAAAQAILGHIVPRTFIHYIRYTQTVEIRESEWRQALARSLSDRIVDLVEG